MNLATFRSNLIKPSVKLRYKFLYDSVDHTSQIIKISTIRRDINLSAGKMLITLNNAGGWWNFLQATNNALGDPVEIQVYIDGDAANAYTIFKGVAKAPVYEGSVVTIPVKDHNSSFLDRKVGSNKSPATWYQFQTRDANEMAWRLLTTDGGLSALASPANTDIHYASFAAWRDQHLTPNNYRIRGQPKGQSVAELLMIIAQMTHSYIWINNDGLVEFAPPHEPGYEYEEGNTGTEAKPGQGRDLIVRDDLVLNDVTVRYGHNFDLGSWVGNVSDTDATSIAKFGTNPKTIEGRIFVHMTSGSAQSDLDDTLTYYAFPLKFPKLITGFPAIMEDLGHQITVSDTLKGWSSIRPFVELIEYNLDTWKIDIKARWAW